MKRLRKIGSRAMERLDRFFSDWEFAALAIFGLLFFEILLIALLAIPTSDMGIGAFARDFRTWCFNYDPATGQMDWFYVMVMLTKPMVLVGLIGLVWHRPLRRVARRGMAELVVVAILALIGVAILGASIFVVGEPDMEIDGDYPFPAERIRTAIEAPEVDLKDHEGERFKLSEQEGRVVLVTAVYARCGASCPVILSQIRYVVETLGVDEQDLVVAPITLDPEEDGPEELSALAHRHGVSAPQYRLLHGDPEEVNRVLDDFSVARIPDEERGEIDHSNLFILIDRQGSIAYRLNLDDRTENWLRAGLRHLVTESTDH